MLIPASNLRHEWSKYILSICSKPSSSSTVLFRRQQENPSSKCEGMQTQRLEGKRVEECVGEGERERERAVDSIWTVSHFAPRQWITLYKHHYMGGPTYNSFPGRELLDQKTSPLSSLQALSCPFEGLAWLTLPWVTDDWWPSSQFSHQEIEY